MKDHLIKQNMECLYCSEEAEKRWVSEWNCEHHYKSFCCKNCGKKNFVRVNFQGSGHDSWGLEDKINSDKKIL
ncbi:MAG: hypothetical protein MAG795_00742 [Candidatus Woesearchaeota archaeon]|nr:hypothetical protein [Candidatus Woesearchaeota archaeon]